MLLDKVVYKGRYGYYPCSYETFLKIKRLNYLFLQVLIRDAKWERWSRKAPHNRVIRKWKPNSLGQKVGFEIIGTNPEPERFLGSIPVDIPQLYKQCRYPQKYSDDVEPLLMSEKEIDGLLNKLEIWFQR